MLHLVHEGLPWFLSAITLYGVWQIGINRRWGWKVGLVANGAWILFDIWWKAWGLIPLSVALILMYAWSLWGYRVKRLWLRRPSQRVPCDLCGGSHIPNGIGLPCVPYENW